MSQTWTRAAAGRTRRTEMSRDDIDRARSGLRERVLTTPVVRSDELDRLTGARLWLKAENLQRGGSFKVRGALLAVDRLAAAGSRGVVAQSTGNHAVAVALAARARALPAVLVLPTDAPAAKQRRIREAGAELVLAGSLLAERLAVAEEIRVLRGLDVVDPYQDPDVVAGQGTATAELIAQVADAGGRLDAVVLPVGGGSALAGACLAAQGTDIELIAAEPAAVPALGAALRAGAPVTVPVASTIADGLRPDRVGALPFSLVRDRVRTVEAVTEPEIREALCAAVLHARLLVEPAAATALAAALRIARAHPGRFTDIGVLLSGGNVEQTLVASLLTAHRAGPEHVPAR
ncbi:pyridoxal-phosphate dependent enzyme [Streptomyces geranii]|uniref:pyridoxal-phosphate dependent enzyme n=1 Tax=Streptomyces geranii TaxID=2058923 RepID=UPI000D048275|nr:pyridoxal-phosphate dependent enzyme [Streptomyces geranii]